MPLPKKILLLGCFLLFLPSCLLFFRDKSEKKIWRASKQMRKLPILLFSSSKGTLGDTFFRLRADSFFDIQGNFGFYRMGKWERIGNTDSLRLHYALGCNNPPTPLDTIAIRLIVFDSTAEKTIETIRIKADGGGEMEFFIYEDKVFE